MLYPFVKLKRLILANPRSITSTEVHRIETLSLLTESDAVD